MGQHTRAVGFVGIVAVAVMLVAAIPGAAGGQTTGIEECRTIDQSGTYELTGTVDGAGQETCIQISADDVVLRGGGNTVDGGDASQGTTGILVNGDSVEVRNVVVSGWGTGVGADSATDGTVAGVTATDNVVGVDLRGTDGLTVEGLEARSNQRWGLAIRQGASGTTVRGGTLTGNDRDLYVRAGGGNAVRSVSLGQSTAAGTRFSATMIRDVTASTCSRRRPTTGNRSTGVSRSVRSVTTRACLWSCTTKTPTSTASTSRRWPSGATTRAAGGRSADPSTRTKTRRRPHWTCPSSRPGRRRSRCSGHRRAARRRPRHRHPRGRPSHPRRHPPRRPRGRPSRRRRRRLGRRFRPLGHQPEPQFRPTPSAPSRAVVRARTVARPRRQRETERRRRQTVTCEPTNRPRRQPSPGEGLARATTRTERR